MTGKDVRSGGGRIDFISRTRSATLSRSDSYTEDPLNLEKPVLIGCRYTIERNCWACLAVKIVRAAPCNLDGCRAYTALLTLQRAIPVVETRRVVFNF